MATAFGGGTAESGGDEETTTVARFGLKVSGLEDEVREKLGYKADAKGVLVTEVDPGSDAADQGLRAGMMIVQVQDKSIATVADFEKAISDKAAQSGVRLLVTDPTGGRRFVFVTPKKSETKEK